MKRPVVYDNELQMSVGLYDGPSPCMQTHAPTIPDGSVDNPPPLDERALGTGPRPPFS